MINKLQKPILEELLKDYCKSRGCHVYLGSNNYPDNSTKFFINDTFYYVDWKECDNVYDVFMKIVKDIDNSKRTPDFYLTMPRNNGKTFYANQVWEYLRNDINTTHELWSKTNPYINTPNIKDVIFNPPATIILWNDGTKTVVKAQDGEPYDPEKGFAMAVTKKHFGNNHEYYDEVKKWLGRYEKKLRKQQKEKDEAEGILCKITLPDVTPAIEAMKNLTKALKGYTAENNDTINKIENVLNSFLVCRELQGCGKCPYAKTCGTGVTCSRAREDDIIEILTTYKNILNKKDLGE